MKRLLSLLLAAVFILALAGCTGDTAGSPTPTATPSGTPASSTPTVSPTDDGDTPQDGIKLPIVDDSMDYDIWFAMTSTVITDNNESSGYQEIEKLTNIHINWTHPSATEGQTQFNLALASQIYPDVFFANPASGPSCWFIGGYDKYIQDGTIRDLSELIPEHAPNYDALRNSDERVRKSTMTDAGAVPYFRTISLQRQPSFMGAIVRQDWLDKGTSGIQAEKVDTFSEYRDMLLALGADKNKGAYINSKSGMFEFFMVGYGVLSEYINRDGTAVFGPTDPGYLEYLTMMNEWYAEGLIDQEFFSRTSFSADVSMLLNGEMGAYWHFYSWLDSVESQVAEAGANLRGVKPPTVNKGDIRKAAYNSIPDTVLGGGNAVITYKSEDVAPIIKWFDYFYTEQGSLIANYGVQGDSWEYDSNGKPQWTQKVLDQLAGGMSIGDVRSLYGTSSIQPKIYAWENAFTPSTSERSLTTGKMVWDRDYVESQTMPEVSISAEKSSEYSSLMGDIKTFVEECTVGFIIGTKPLGDWDKYVSQIQGMGIDTCTAIQQEALERFADR